MNIGQGIWKLDPSIIFLNHGSLGSCPIPVLEAQRDLRDRMEERPIQFVLRDLQPRLAEVRRQLAGLVGANMDDLALVTNATTAVNTVLRSLDFQPGDEILTTNHEYNACLNAVDVVAHRTGATVVQAVIPFPISGPGDVLDPIRGAVSSRTRLALISHVTSATGIIFPLAQIVAELQGQGIDVLVDGAHAPALLDLELDAIGAAYYAATCHKWLCSPRGTGFLHVRHDRQAGIRPLVISHGTNDPRTEIPLFRREFDWQGSHDPTGFLSIPTAIETLAGLLDGGLPALRQRNHELAIRARDMLCDVFQLPPLVPDSMVSAMASVPIDHRFTDRASRERLDRSLRETSRIEVPIMLCRLNPAGPDRWLIRVSCQAYNEESDLDALRGALTGALTS